MELQSISSFCELNRGGLIRLEYAPLHHIQAVGLNKILNDSWNMLYAVSFKQGKNWLSMPILPSRDVYSEQGATGEQGPFYEQTVQGIVPGLRPAVQQQFDLMARMRFVVRLRDKNRRYWLIGSMDEGLNFSAAGTTSEHGGLNAYTISFTGLSDKRTVAYNPVF